jgi:hypothetical protein
MIAPLNLFLMVILTGLIVLLYNRSVSPADLEKNMGEGAYAYYGRLLPNKKKTNK